MIFTFKLFSQISRNFDACNHGCSGSLRCSRLSFGGYCICFLGICTICQCIGTVIVTVYETYDWVDCMSRDISSLLPSSFAISRALLGQDYRPLFDLLCLDWNSAFGFPQAAWEIWYRRACNLPIDLSDNQQARLFDMVQISWPSTPTQLIIPFTKSMRT